MVMQTKAGKIAAVLFAHGAKQLKAAGIEGMSDANLAAILDDLKPALIASWTTMLESTLRQQASKLRVPSVDPTLDYDERTVATRFKANKSALEIIASTPQSELTEADLRAIAKYSGWGGLDGKMYVKNTLDFSPDFQAWWEATLPDAVPMPESEALIYEYYTPIELCMQLAEKIRPALASLTGGEEIQALEPSAGIGRFVRAFRQPGYESMNWDAAELSPLSGLVFKTLFPSIGLYEGYFEQWIADKGLAKGRVYDFIVANPPYGPRGEHVRFDPDPTTHVYKNNYHYFMQRCVDLLKPGGIGVFLVPYGFTTGQSKATRVLRRAILEQAQLTWACRFPETLFPQSQVVVDMVVLRARGGRVEDAPKAEEFIWKGDYYSRFPEHILGTVQGDGTDDTDVDEAGDAKRKRYKVVGKFTSIPDILELPITQGLTLKPLRPMVTMGPAATVLSEELTERELSRYPALVQHVMRLADMGDRYFADLGRGNIDAANKAWPILHDKLTSFTHLYAGDRGVSTPHQMVELLQHRNRWVQTFLSFYTEDGELIEALESAPEIPRDQLPGKWDYAGQAELVYRRDAVATLSALQKFNQDVGGDASVDTIVAELLREGWCRDGIEWDQMVPARDYYMGNLWPKIDRAEKRFEADETDASASTQLNELRKMVNGAATIDDIIYQGNKKVLLDPSLGWVPLDILGEWLSHLHGGGRNDVDIKVTRKDGLITFPGVGYWELSLDDRILRERLMEYGVNEYSMRSFKRKLAWLNGDTRNFSIGRDEYQRTPEGRRTDSNGQSLEDKDQVRLRLMGEWKHNFHQFVLADEKVTDRVLDGYNRANRGRIVPQVDDSPIDIDGWNYAGFVPRPYQYRGAKRLIRNNGGLAAYDVGLGKTLTGILSIAKAKQDGLARRPAVLVPKSLAVKWYEDIKRAMPHWEVAIIGGQFSEKEERDLPKRLWRYVLTDLGTGQISRQFGIDEHDRVRTFKTPGAANQFRNAMADEMAAAGEISSATPFKKRKNNPVPAVIWDSSAQVPGDVLLTDEERAYLGRAALRTVMKVRDQTPEQRAQIWRSFQGGLVDVVIITYPTLGRTKLDAGFLKKYIAENTQLKNEADKALRDMQERLDEESKDRELQNMSAADRIAYNIENPKSKVLTPRQLAVLKQGATAWILEKLMPQRTGTGHKGPVMPKAIQAKKEDAPDVADFKAKERESWLAMQAEWLERAAREDVEDLEKFAQGESLTGYLEFDPGVTWNDIGIDFILVDEAQSFKNLYMPGNRPEGKIEYLGSGTEGSARAYQLDVRTAAIRERAKGGGVYLLSATPAKNSPLEFFSLYSYVNPRVWSSQGIYTVDDFVSTFCALEDTLIPDLRTFDMKRASAVVGFQNLDILLDILERYGEYKDVNDIRKEYPSLDIQVPDARPLREVFPLDAVSQEKASAMLEEMRENMDAGSDTIYQFGEYRNPSGKLFTLAPPPLMLMNTLIRLGAIGLHPALDDRVPKWKKGQPDWIDKDVGTAVFVGRYRDYKSMKEAIANGEVNPSSAKIDMLCENVAGCGDTGVCDTGERNVRDHTPMWSAAGCGHIIFVESKAAHALIEARLIEVGVPPDRIAILNADVTPNIDKRTQVAKDFNGDPDQDIPPKYDVLICNSVAYEGIDLQNRTCAMHHVDLPWEPATIRQRDGRGVRSGNIYKVVAIYYYIAECSPDGFRENKILGKKGWLDNLFEAKAGGAKAIDNPNLEVVDDPLEVILSMLCTDEQRQLWRDRIDKLRQERAAKQEMEYKTRARTAFNQWAGDNRKIHSASPEATEVYKRKMADNAEVIAAIGLSYWPYQWAFEAAKQHPDIFQLTENVGPVYTGCVLGPVPGVFSPMFGAGDVEFSINFKADHGPLFFRKVGTPFFRKFDRSRITSTDPSAQKQLTTSNAPRMVAMSTIKPDKTVADYERESIAWDALTHRLKTEQVLSLASSPPMYRNWFATKYADQVRDAMARAPKVAVVADGQLFIKSGPDANYTRGGEILLPTDADFDRFVDLAVSNTYSVRSDLAPLALKWWGKPFPSGLQERRDAYRAARRVEMEDLLWQLYQVALPFARSHNSYGFRQAVNSSGLGMGEIIQALAFRGFRDATNALDRFYDGVVRGSVKMRDPAVVRAEEAEEAAAKEEAKATAGAAAEALLASRDWTKEQQLWINRFRRTAERGELTIGALDRGTFKSNGGSRRLKQVVFPDTYDEVLAAFGLIDKTPGRAENPSRHENPPPSKVQSLLFPRDQFTRAKAVSWATRHNFKAPRVEETEKFWRIRQHDPMKFDNFATIPLGESGVQAILGIHG